MNWGQVYGNIAERCKSPSINAAVVAEVSAATFDVLIRAPFGTAMAFVARGMELAEHRKALEPEPTVNTPE